MREMQDQNREDKSRRERDALLSELSEVDEGLQVLQSELGENEEFDQEKGDCGD